MNARPAAHWSAITANLATLVGVVWFLNVHRHISTDTSLVLWAFSVLAAANLWALLATGLPSLLATILKRRRLEEDARIRVLENAKN